MTAAVEDKPVTEAKPEPVKTEKAELNGHAEEEYASFDELLAKPARERDVKITTGGKVLKIHIRAIGTDAYDQLVASCPPTTSDQDRGMAFNQKAFQPKLVSACVTRPKMDLDRATRLMSDPNWSGGEWGGLYAACVEICQSGINVPFNESD